MVRRQMRKAEMRITIKAVNELAQLPLKQRLWFAWRIVVVRSFPGGDRR
jgi:hypothetical protein